MQVKRSLICTLVLLVAATAPSLRTIDTPYYTVHTDLPDLAAREAVLRISKMADEYAARTQNFAGKIDQKLPFYLYRTADEYFAAGAPKGTNGYCTGTKLMAVAGAKMTGLTWQTIQHEGFHQFAHATIRQNLPPWLDEGLAEYFGEAIFTGDGYVDGAIPPWRAKRVKHRIQAGEFKSLRELMKLQKKDWNRELLLANYDQAWSLIQFLAHGDGDKYQKSFNEFMNGIAGGHDPVIAFEHTIGDIDTFELKWKRYWMSLPDDPTPEIYAKAVTDILNSFLTRATGQGQTFQSFDEFVSAGTNEQVKTSNQDWLPPQLLKEGIAGAQQLEKMGAKFELRTSPANEPRITGALPK
jgi:hypothetical protein